MEYFLVGIFNEKLGNNMKYRPGVFTQLQGLYKQS